MSLPLPAEAGPAEGPSPRRPAGASVDVVDLCWQPSGLTRPVLPGISLQVAPGERVLLAGPSGSGKSTLLRALAGVLTTTETGRLTGTVHVDGRDPGEGGAHVGLLVQDPADAAVAGQVGRDVAFGPENLGVPRDRIWDTVRGALAAVRFPYDTQHPVNALSGGEAQRLALAGVLALGPRLVLLDEPSAMLDPGAAAAVRRSVTAAARGTGATMVLVEHRLEAWVEDVDRLVVLDAGGRVVADGALGPTLEARADALAAQGVWVPGVTPPAPLAVPARLCAPVLRPPTSVPVPAGSPTTSSYVVRAEGVGVVRRPTVGLTAARAPRPPVAALTGVDVEVRAGEVLAVVGPSGAGKSTLTALLAGIESPTTGTVEAGGWLRAGGAAAPGGWTSPELAARVGWVPQQAELAVVSRTVREDVLSTSRLLGLEEEAARQRVDALLEVLGLTARADADPHRLSGGEMRRFALAGAVAHGPALLVLDEPTVGQDRLTWSAVAGVVAAARSAGVAVVLATHDALLAQLADRTLRLEGGRVVPPGTTPAASRGPVRSASSPVRALPGAPGAGAAASGAVPGTGTGGPGGAGGAVRAGSRRGLAAGCGPLSLLGASALLLLGALFVRDLPTALAGVGVELLLGPAVLGLGRPSSLRASLRRLAPGLLGVLSVAFSNWLLSPGHDVAAGVTAGLRVAFFVVPGVLLAARVDPFVLGDHLGQRLRLPARPVVAAAAALQRFEGLDQQWHQLRRTRRVRGLDAGRSPLARARQVGALTAGLLVQSLRQAGRMAVAMEARGFSTPRANGARRTWAEPAPWRRADSLMTALGLAVAAVPALLSRVL